MFADRFSFSWVHSISLEDRELASLVAMVMWLLGYEW